MCFKPVLEFLRKGAGPKKRQVGRKDHSFGKVRFETNTEILKKKKKVKIFLSDVNGIKVEVKCSNMQNKERKYQNTIYTISHFDSFKIYTKSKIKLSL